MTRSSYSTARRVASLLAVALALSGCANAIDRLENVGKAPKLSAVEDPTAQAGYKPFSMPMP